MAAGCGSASGSSDSEFTVQSHALMQTASVHGLCSVGAFICWHLTLFIRPSRRAHRTKRPVHTMQVLQSKAWASSCQRAHTAAHPATLSVRPLVHRQRCSSAIVRVSSVDQDNFEAEVLKASDW